MAVNLVSVVAVLRCAKCGAPVADAIAVCESCTPHAEVRQDVTLVPGGVSTVKTRSPIRGGKPAHKVTTRDALRRDGRPDATFEYVVDRTTRRRIERTTEQDGSEFVKVVDLEDQDSHGPAEARRQGRT
jgi:hypothetical protein